MHVVLSKPIYFTSRIPAPKAAYAVLTNLGDSAAEFPQPISPFQLHKETLAING